MSPAEFDLLKTIIESKQEDFPGIHFYFHGGHEMEKKGWMGWGWASCNI